MSIEVEIKVKIQNRKQIMDSLKKIGFLENRCVVETDIYYTSTHHNFAALGEALRIRTVKDPESPKETSVITYKGAKLDQVSMTRQELETEVGDGETVRKILEHIGFCPVSPVEKKRLYLNKDNMTACLDNVKGLGDYLELEILTDTEEKRTEALKQIEDVLEALGYSMEDTTRTSYLSMLMKKETDINIATHMIAKGFQNAYDIAILVSGDTDYVQVIRTLHDLGKIVVIAHFPEQNIAKYQGMYDAEVILDDDLLHRAGNASYGREKRSRKRYPSRFPSEKK